MIDGLSFGWRTAVLSVAAAQLLVIAVALTRCLANRTANRTLAALLVVLVGVFLPWLIGFAGFYDKWRWLTFLPVTISLAVAPLLWFYVTALVTGRWPDRALLHLIPAAAQFAYLLSGFLLPMPLKDRWADASAPVAGAVVTIALIAGLAGYGRASLRLLARYRALLGEARSDDARFAARWLSRAVAAIFAMLPLWGGYALWDAIRPLGYQGLMGMYLLIAAFALYLAIEGWRHAALPFPRLTDLTPVAAPPPPARDWHAQGESWAAAVRAGGWAADPELSLASLARRLGTNTAYLSRALNEGLGVSFSAFVNGLRSEAVAEAIDAGSRADLLELALDAGFASKASFNRAFQARFGTSPSSYRHASSRKNAPQVTENEANAAHHRAIRPA